MVFKIDPALVFAFGVNISRIAINPGDMENSDDSAINHNHELAVAMNKRRRDICSNSTAAQTTNTATKTIHLRCTGPIALIFSPI
jgi:hypothetical protein